MRTNYEVQVYIYTNVELKSAITSPDTPVVAENVITDTLTRKTSTVRSGSYCIFRCACAPRPTNSTPGSGVEISLMLMELLSHRFLLGLYVLVIHLLLSINLSNLSPLSRNQRRGSLPSGMDVHLSSDISVNLPRKEFLSCLSALPTAKFKSVRASLFKSAKSKRLTLESAILVNRRDTASKPISTKLCEYIIIIMYFNRLFKTLQGSPKGVMRNGKRDFSTFEASQSSLGVLQLEKEELEDLAAVITSDPPAPSPPTERLSDLINPELPPRENFALSMVMKEITTLKFFF